MPPCTDSSVCWQRPLFGLPLSGCLIGCGILSSASNSPLDKQSPNSVRNCWGLSSGKTCVLSPGESRKRPRSWGGRCVEHLPSLLCFKIRSFEEFGKSPSPDEIANCAIHRTDFFCNGSDTRGIKMDTSYKLTSFATTHLSGGRGVDSLRI